MNGDAAPEAERPEPATASLVRNFLVIAIALLLLKLLLVSQREIVPEQHDAEAYASASLYDLRLIFFNSAGHPPGAPLVMALARSLGIPYRVFIEVFLAVAAFLFFRPLVASMRLGMIAVTLSYGVLLFHPSLILEMDRAMSDSVSFFCWLMGAGGIIGFVAAPREKLPRWSSDWSSSASHSRGSRVRGKERSSSSKWLQLHCCLFFCFADWTAGAVAAQSSPASAP